MPESETSLRERSKLRRRAAIQRAGLQLFAERGYEGATVADIAEAADVSPRTVSLYFPTKLDIALSTSTDLATRLTTLFEDHPDLSFSDVVDRWLLAEVEATEPALAALTTAMFEANPALRAVSNSRIAQVAVVAGPVLIAESGLAADDPMLPVMGAAVAGVLTQYLTSTGAGRPSRARHDELMRYLRAVIAAARGS